MEYNPIIPRGEDGVSPRDFYDHYHETHTPFEPEELLTKQPIGASYFADYKTYYNERIKSNTFEDTVGARDDINNSLPTPYAFFKAY